MLEYIVDFYCHELMLAIEIDGDSHLFKYDYDNKRQGELEEEGVVFLRFTDLEIKHNMFSVGITLEQVVQELIDKKKNR
jgi:very-short-patch-repair endonuclease